MCSGKSCGYDVILVIDTSTTYVSSCMNVIVNSHRHLRKCAPNMIPLKRGIESLPYVRKLSANAMTAADLGTSAEKSGSPNSWLGAVRATSAIARGLFFDCCKSGSGLQDYNRAQM